MKNLTLRYKRPGPDLGPSSAQQTSSLPNSMALFLLGIYRTVGTTHLGGSCRFEPSCSSYAQSCFRKFSFMKASYLVLIRLLKCQPLGPWGYDPVPIIIKGQNREAE